MWLLLPVLLATLAGSQAAVLDQATVSQALDNGPVTILAIQNQGVSVPQGRTLTLSGGTNVSAALTCQATGTLRVAGTLVLVNLTASLSGASPWVPACVELSKGGSLVLRSVLLMSPCSGVQLPSWSLCQQPANFRGLTVSKGHEGKKGHAAHKGGNHSCTCHHQHQVVLAPTAP
jgi:hypothetical protein